MIGAGWTGQSEQVWQDRYPSHLQALSSTQGIDINQRKIINLHQLISKGMNDMVTTPFMSAFQCRDPNS